MTTSSSETKRLLRLATLLALASFSAVACSVDAPSDDASASTGASTDDITGVDQAAVKRQSIGNCWLYATTGWLEALNKGATGEEKNTSESWLTYWHWFESLANGFGFPGEKNEIQTGGSFRTAAGLINRYGIMMERDFITSESDAEMSSRQSSALEAVNASLRSGALRDIFAKPAAQRDRAAIRAELDKAWRLDEATIARIDAVFGKNVDKTIDRAYANSEPGSGVIRGKDFPVRLKDPTTGAFVTRALSDATAIGSFGNNGGSFAWADQYYPSGARERRAFLKRVQRALHDRMPVILSWHVDFNALTADSRFSMEELKRKGPGHQGGHMTVMHDYEATNVPGFGTLKAGEDATPAQMEAALSDKTEISFFRVKNSWGAIRPDRWSTAPILGYHDLDMAYLDGPIKDCPESAGNPPDPNKCTSMTVPLNDVTMPPGY